MEQSQSEGCCWLWRDGLRECEEGDCGRKCRWRKAKQPRKQGDTAESCVGGGAITIASLSPRASISSGTIERLAQRAPDALNYRVGPHPGCSFNCLICQTVEKDPRQGIPLRAWTGRATEKDWPKRPLTTSYKRVEKRLWSGHDPCRGGSPCPCTLGAARIPTSQAAVPPSCSALTGAEMLQVKKSCVYARRFTLVMSSSLWPCRLWHARLLYRGVLQTRTVECIGQYWSPYPSRALYFLLP